MNLLDPRNMNTFCDMLVWVALVYSLTNLFFDFILGLFVRIILPIIRK